MARPVSAVILVGGKSARMGVDKATLVLNGQTLLDHVVEVATAVADEVILAGGPQRPGSVHVDDVLDGAGPVAGLVAGMEIAQHETVLALSCDLPFLSVPALIAVLDALPGHEAAVPIVAGHRHPLHAAYARSVRHTAARMLGANVRQLTALLSTIRTRWIDENELSAVDPELLSVFNVNTPGEWEQAVSLAGRRS